MHVGILGNRCSQYNSMQESHLQHNAHVVMNLSSPWCFAVQHPLIVSFVYYGCIPTWFLSTAGIPGPRPASWAGILIFNALDRNAMGKPFTVPIYKEDIQIHNTFSLLFIPDLDKYTHLRFILSVVSLWKIWHDLQVFCVALSILKNIFFYIV